MITYGEMPKNIIFYFTGTGNSLKAAKDVANVLDDCKVIPMTKSKEIILSDDSERIGFVFPVYSWTLPHFVKNFFIENHFPKNENIYYFMVITHAGGRGNTIPIANRLLNKKGIRLKSAFDVKMVSNYIILSDIPKNADEINKAAQQKIISIANIIHQKKIIEIQKMNPFIFYAGIGTNFFPTMDKKYKISDECTGCAVCVNVCQAKNIILKNNKPIFNHNCEQCMACIHHCPCKAINYKNITQKRSRYINPGIKLEEIITRNIV